MTDFLDTPSGRRIAYNRLEGEGTGVVFLGGFMSDMEGSKATALEAWAKMQGRPFLRFDYSGHGVSSGEFRDGCIGDWAEDAQAAIESLTEGPQILVGSSMGGWISLLMCKRLHTRVAGLVTIAAAPDFTEDGFWAGFDDGERQTLMQEGVVMVPSDYAAPYPITRRLIEDGRDHLIMRSPLALPFPVRFLQGTADTSVSVETANALLAHAQGGDIRLTLVKGADHSFSTPDCLKTVEAAIFEVLARI
ncbi:alpha/beta hydrolase [Celeribacter neptunius]|uniref:Palmitoyl-protein thioesterase ABHD10, mitochondrial n=1 Tax=Celeribacter neptunius TaxID=588602 RepID=A0A1I3IX78_9RHOB|nr:alpha/beta hydrolase [Celeribacter neptunius]SFI52490.1 Pimeloyl-ACP methyl ester carboxylesterase [Celeribacter neptunius]